MSFVGAGCKFMEDSVIDGLWPTIYAKNSLPKMMEGKTYTKTLRSCLLTDAALLYIYLLRAAKCPINSDLPSYSPSAPQETKQMDVEEEELDGNNADHDWTNELGIDRAGVLVFRSLSDMTDDGTRSQ